MEYCITVLVETFEPAPRFRPPMPVETVWGQAWRADEEGRYVWEGGLYVMREPTSPHLIAHLPPSLRLADWQALSIGGEGLRDFEVRVNQAVDACGPIDLTRHPLLQLLEELLGSQRRWAVFFAFHCDDIARDHRRPLRDLPEIVTEAYRWSNEEARGFSCCDGA
jgi:hypothetical protein